MAKPRRIIDQPMLAQLHAEETPRGTRYRMSLIDRRDAKTSYGYVRSPQHLDACAGIDDLFDDLAADFASRKRVPVLVSGVISELLTTATRRTTLVKTLMCTSVRKDDGKIVPGYN